MAHAGLHGQGHGGHGQSQILPQFGQGLAPGGEGNGQDQLFPGPGHGHIQQPQLLGHHLLVQTQGHRLAGQGGILDHPLRLQPLGTHAQLRVEEHRGLQIVPVQPSAQAAHQHHRLLQPLGAVDGQDGHALPLLGGAGGGQLSPRLAQPVQPQQELEQGPAAPVLHLPGQGIEGQQILLALAPLVHGAENAQQVRRLIDVPDELAAGPVSRPKAQPLQPVQKVRTVLLPPGRPGGHGGIEVLPPVVRAQLGQPVCGKAEHRGAQGGQQGHVLTGVVHQAQNGQGHVPLGGGQKVLVPVGHPGDVLLPQGPGVEVQHHAGAAQQYHHVAGPQGPLAVPLGHHQGLVQQLTDALGGKAGLGLILVLPVLPVLLPQIG